MVKNVQSTKMKTLDVCKTRMMKEIMCIYNHEIF